MTKRYTATDPDALPPSDEEDTMTDDRDHDHRASDPSEDEEAQREDWDPMMPETTVPDPASDQAASEEEWQEKLEEERQEKLEEERPG